MSQFSASIESADLSSDVKAPARCRILIADDNVDAVDSMQMMLELLGNEVSVARDGLQAVEAASVFRPDIILMDLGMPRLSGYEATRCIKRQPWGASIVVVALTGWGQESDRQRSREAGCDHHLVKPVALSDLQALLDGASGERRTAAAA